MTNHEQPQRSPGDGRPRAFQGQASDVEAFVYIELPRAVDRDANVQAEISGPWCDHAHTLKASVPFGKVSDTPTTLLAAAVADPCFWSPATPHYYRISVTWQQGSDSAAHWEWLYGLRRFGVQGGNFLFNGRRWVVRGIWQDECQGTDWLDDLRDASAVWFVASPDDALCEQACRRGVALLPVFSAAQPDLAGELVRVSSQVAALAVCITAGPQAGSFGPAPRNLVIGQHVRASEALTVADWADFLVCDVDRTDQLRSLRQFAVPVVVHRRRSPQVESVAAARRECDVLQRDLATEGDFAGYVVSH